MATKEVKKAPAKPKTKAVAVKPKSEFGRPKSMTEETQEKILGSIRLGLSVKDAMKIQGLSERSFYNWIKRGSDEFERLERDSDAIPNPSEVEFLQFFQSVERAKSEAAGLHVATVANAAKRGDWRASAWWLERQRPDEFGKDAPTFIANQTNNTQINLAVTMGELEQLVNKIKAMRGDNGGKAS
jgi:transposase